LIQYSACRNAAPNPTKRPPHPNPLPPRVEWAFSCERAAAFIWSAEACFSACNFPGKQRRRTGKPQAQLGHSTILLVILQEAAFADWRIPVTIGQLKMPIATGILRAAKRRLAQDNSKQGFFTRTKKWWRTTYRPTNLLFPIASWALPAGKQNPPLIRGAAQGGGALGELAAQGADIPG
jgi:hypothetical protein